MEGQKGHNNDIAVFISDQLRGPEGPQMEEIRGKLCYKASGVFLWTVLVVRILNKTYDHGQTDAMDRRLGEIPEKLDDLFAEILTRDNQNRDNTVLLLQWTLFAKRSLRPSELYLAMKAGSKRSDEWSPQVPSDDTIKRFILSCSKGLTEISTSLPPVVQFIHESVRDFLFLRNGLVNLQPGLQDKFFGSSHDQIKENCLHYLSTVDEPPQPNDGNPRKRTSMDQSLNDEARNFIARHTRFLEYAVTNVFTHADAAAGGRVPQKHFVSDFNGNRNAELRK